jgi:hypothetical protein
MQAQETAKPQTDFKGWVVWLQWLLANVVGRGASLFAALHIVSAVSDLRDLVIRNEVLWYFFTFVPLGMLFGLGIGTAQWLALRKRLASIRAWIGASVISWTLGGVAGVAVYFYECPNDACGTEEWAHAFMVSLCAIGAAGWIFFGTTQWLILRRRVQRAGWWLLTAIGEAIPWLLTWVFYAERPTERVEIWFALWVATLVLWTAAYAILPGILLVWLLRHPISPQRDLW